MSKRDGVEAFVRLLGEELDIEESFDGDTPLVSSGIIDSFDLVALLAVIEMRFQVTINPEELDIEVFDTPAQMFAYVQASS
jgi:acyl carrier protein